MTACALELDVLELCWSLSLQYVDASRNGMALIGGNGMCPLIETILVIL